MENTRITYIYRDAANYKVHNECVVCGKISDEQKTAILECLDEGEYFVPSMVGLPEKRFDSYDPDDDHPFFELNNNSFEETDTSATVEITVEELVKSFSKAKGMWNQIEHSRALELLNLLIDEKLNDEGGHSTRVIERLLSLGFSESELLSLQFQRGDIMDAAQEVHSDV